MALRALAAVLRRSVNCWSLLLLMTLLRLACCSHEAGPRPLFKTASGYVLDRPKRGVRKRLDTVGEITTRRQKPLVLRIMVEQGRTRILFLSGLTPRCEQIFPHRSCFQPVRRIRQRCPDDYVLQFGMVHATEAARAGRQRRQKRG